jgi:Ca2+:H+ antiporter
MAGTGGRLRWLVLAAPVLGLLAWFAIGKAGGAVAGLLLAAMLLANVVGAVQHAEVLAHRLGEPYGTLVLTLAVTVIEASMIVSLMLNGEPNPHLARDSVHAVVVLVLHGLAGMSILLAAWKHGVPEFRTEGANAFLTVLLPMAVLVLVLPNHVLSAPGPYFSPVQVGFVAFTCLALYGVFLFVQTVRHRAFFTAPDTGPHTGPDTGADTAGGPQAPPPGSREAWIAFAMLVASLVAVVLLAKSMAPFIRGGVAALGAPLALEGVIIAAIVLLPETASAMQAALRNRLQTSINLALGSAVACIGLTIPTVALVAWWMGQELALGIDQGATVLLALSFATAIITYGTGRTNLLAGFVHLVLLATWVFVIFQP